MTRFLICVLVFLFSPNLALADNYPKNPKIDILNYAFKIGLSDTSDEIQGVAKIDVRYLSDGVTSLRFDLIKASPALGNKGMTVTHVLSEGKSLNYKHENEALFIELPAPSQINRQILYIISYHGLAASGLKISNNKYGDRTFFSDNWPDKGRNWLPIIDHPYDKATCEFIITAPAHYQVVSNGLKIEETDLKDGNRITHWKQSVPIASWLYVVGVARFAVQYVDKFDNKSIESWVYYQDRDAGFYDFAEPTKKVLEFYSDNVGSFSYEKLANIQSNSVSGGMEAASAILYSENSVVGDKNERWRDVVIHEIAHQWFGNAVTEYDWDDVWLSEGFATYFTLLFIEHEYGHDAFMKGLASSKKRVNAFYALHPDYRIVHDNLNDMGQVTSSQTYQKGSWILHMLRGLVGEDAFRKAIQSYYKKYQNLNATTTDFRKEMEGASGMDLKVFFDQWLYKPGTLTLTGTWHYNAQKKEVTIQLKQAQTDSSIFKLPMEVAIYSSKQKDPLLKTIQINGKQNEFNFKIDSEPEKILLDPNSWVLMEATITKR